MPPALANWESQDDRIMKWKTPNKCAEIQKRSKTPKDLCVGVAGVGMLVPNNFVRDGAWSEHGELLREQYKLKLGEVARRSNSINIMVAPLQISSGATRCGASWLLSGLTFVGQPAMDHAKESISNR